MASFQQAGDIFGQVFQAIWSNKLRSFLTMFGIAWGVASLLLLVGLGEGFRSGQRRNMANLGNNVIMMWSGTIPALPNQHTGMRPYRLNLSDAEAIRTEATTVKDVTALLRRDDLKQVSDYQSAGGSVMGVQPNWSAIRFVKMDEGRWLSQADLAERRSVIVLGGKSARLLFPGHPAVGSMITLNGYRFQVIGVAAWIGRGNNDGDNQRVYIPISTMLEFFPLKGENMPDGSITSIQYQPIVKGENEAARATVHQIIARRHGFDASLADAFEEWDTIKEERMVGAIFDAMDLFLGGVGAVTLALGAVGIVNIMLVSVSERTREIGLRKALGATKRSILIQFFFEGLALTGVSGVIGVAGAAIFMFLLNLLIGGAGPEGFDPPRLVPWTAAMAIGSLSLCGVIAGLYPANIAANLEPVEALRKE